MDRCNRTSAVETEKERIVGRYLLMKVGIWLRLPVPVHQFQGKTRKVSQSSNSLVNSLQNILLKLSLFTIVKKVTEAVFHGLRESAQICNSE